MSKSRQLKKTARAGKGSRKPASTVAPSGSKASKLQANIGSVPPYQDWKMWELSISRAHKRFGLTVKPGVVARLFGSGHPDCNLMIAQVDPDYPLETGCAVAVKARENSSEYLFGFLTTKDAAHATQMSIDSISIVAPEGRLAPVKGIPRAWVARITGIRGYLD